MKIWTHSYTLHPGTDPSRAALSPRHGVLLKIEFDDNTTGHSDLHPWPEFGHLSLKDHLASLEQNNPTPLANISLNHARNDAIARMHHVSLFADLPQVRSHALFTKWTQSPRVIFEQYIAQGYTTAKLKIGNNLPEEIAAIKQFSDLPIRLRLDANSSFNSQPEALAALLFALTPEVHNNIDFLEDPCNYNAILWQELSQSIPLALDWHIPQTSPPWLGADTLILKPASQIISPLAANAALSGMKIVVTHSMDHPFGQAVAMHTAMTLRQQFGSSIPDCGLQAVGLYQPDAFSEQLPTHGPFISPPPGTGFGFNDLLDALPWRKLT